MHIKCDHLLNIKSEKESHVLENWITLGDL